MTTTCSGCRKNITGNEIEGKDFVLCNCNRFTPKGSNLYNRKGGKQSMTKKTTKKITKDISNNLLKCSKCKHLTQKSSRNPDKWKNKEGKFVCRSCNKK